MNRAMMNCDNLKHANMPVIVVSKACGGEARQGELLEKVFKEIRPKFSQI